MFNLSKSLKTFNVGSNVRVNDVSIADTSNGHFTASTSAGNVVVFDARCQTSHSPIPIATLNHGCDVLTHDVSNFDENNLISGGVNSSVFCWDLRNCHLPFIVLTGHSHPIRRIVASFHSAQQFCSASYDFSVR